MDEVKKSRGGAARGSREQEFYCSYTELWPVGRLVPNPRNPNTHPKKQLQLLAEIIRGHGWRAPITVSRRSGYIVRGHGRFAAALLIGCEQVPVDLQEYASEAEEYADMVADNQIAELSEIDQEELQGLIADLDAEGYNLGLLGFTDKNLQELLNAKAEISEDNFDVDGAAEAAAQNTITKRGDLWLLGNHRLLCGDSTDRDCVDRLMGGELADMVFTDPPYNVDYEGRTKKKLKIQNDKKSNDDFYSFLCAAFERMFEASKPGSAAYIWFADRESINFRSAATAAGWDLKQGLIWVKNVFVMGRQDYQWNHEPCQPPGTMVRTPNGEVPIEDLKDGDRVLSFDKYSSAVKGFKEGCAVKTASREYDGDLYGVSVDGLTTWATDNHRFTVKINKSCAKKYCVYLMRRGKWWRVGNTVLYDARGFGLKSRMRQEKAEEGWVLFVVDTKIEAECAEQMVCAKFGLPYTHWETDRGFVNDKSDHRTVEQIEWIYKNLDLEEMRDRALKCLKHYGRRIEYPFAVRDEFYKPFGTHASVDVRACNLIPEVMMLPVPYAKYHGTKTFDWTEIDKVETKKYKGLVYSLEVEEYEHYIADGIVTHNCLYAYKPGAAHRWYGGRKLSTTLRENFPVQLAYDDDGKALLTFTFGLDSLVLKVPKFEVVDVENASTCWHIARPAASRLHPTMKPIALVAKGILNNSKEGELVLDLFGGSGSTLVACEETGRRCCTMELDPVYCDVIVKRWEQLTGKKAVLKND